MDLKTLASSRTNMKPFHANFPNLLIKTLFLGFLQTQDGKPVISLYSLGWVFPLRIAGLLFFIGSSFSTHFTAVRQLFHPTFILISHIFSFSRLYLITRYFHSYHMKRNTTAVFDTILLTSAFSSFLYLVSSFLSTASPTSNKHCI